MAKTRKDNTGKERQARRREREKQWLRENGWQSWEALHTALMNGKAKVFDERQYRNNATEEVR